MSSRKNTPPPQNEMPQDQAQADSQQRVPFDGFKQVLEMLRIADPEFRESLLRRLAARDRELAQSLRRDLDN